MSETNSDYRLPILIGYLVDKQYDEFKKYLRKMVREGLPADELKEAILQTYLHAGYPCALEGLFVLKSVLKEGYDSGSGGNSLQDSLDIWRKSGEKTCRTVYGENYDKLIENVRVLSTDLADWMITEGYGKVMSRSGLSIQMREMISIVVLTMNWYPRQLHSHLKGAVNVGCTHDEVEQLLQSLKEISFDKANMALILWQRINADD